MDANEFAWKMIDLMPRIVRGYSRQAHDHLSRGKITHPQYWVLEYLVEKGSARMSVLAGHLKISRPAATGIIARLTAQGFVKRIQNAKDRRGVHVEITAKGRRAIDAIRHHKHRVIADIFGKASAGDRRRQIEILERVAKLIDVERKSAHE